MTGTPPPLPAPGRGSLLRLLTGGVLIIVAMTVAVFGFVNLIGVLESDGYGTPAMRKALILLGTAGACLAGGLATIIWDISKRYESPSEMPPD